MEIEQALAGYKASLTAGKSKERKARFKATEAALAKAHTRDSLQAIEKLTAVVDGKRQIMSNPPLVIRGEDMTDMDTDVLFDRLRGLLINYRKTLQSDRRRLLDQFTLTDIAQKVVGVGSVGTRAWILLLEAGVEAEALLLQAKEAGPSALAGYAGKSEYSHQGERVVAGQHLMQASSGSSSAGFARGGQRAASTPTTTCGSCATGNYLRSSRRWSPWVCRCMPVSYTHLTLPTIYSV